MSKNNQAIKDILEHVTTKPPPACPTLPAPNGNPRSPPTANDLARATQDATCVCTSPIHTKKSNILSSGNNKKTTVYYCYPK